MDEIVRFFKRDPKRGKYKKEFLASLNVQARALQRPFGFIFPSGIPASEFPNPSRPPFSNASPRRIPPPRGNTAAPVWD